MAYGLGRAIACLRSVQDANAVNVDQEKGAIFAMRQLGHLTVPRPQ